MVKSELARKLTEDFPDLTQAGAERMVNAILDQISDRVTSGGRAELRGFGVFKLKTISGRLHHNPRTMERVAKEERQLVTFKASRNLLERMNPDLPPKTKQIARD